MKYSKKICAHDKVIAALNACKGKYLNYKTSNSDNTIGNACVRCHDNDRLDFFGIPKNIQHS